MNIRSDFLNETGCTMPIVSELQRDRVALLLTLNVLVFVGYAVAVVMLVAVPSVWLVTFLIVGLAYNVFELWQSSPYKQPPDAVGDRARSDSRSGSTVAPPRLGRTHRTDPVLGTQGFAVGRESLAQRLAELQASIPLQTIGSIEAIVQSAEVSISIAPTEAEAAVLAELPAQMLANPESESVEITADTNASLVAPTDAETAATIMTNVAAANDPHLEDIVDAELPVLHTRVDAVLEAAESASPVMPEILVTTSDAVLKVDTDIAGTTTAELVSVELDVSKVNLVEVTEPVLESVVAETRSEQPLISLMDDPFNTAVSAAAIVAEDRVEEAAQLHVEAEPAVAVASLVVPQVTYLAGRRRDVVDIVIASIASDAKRAQPSTTPVTEEQPPLAAKVRTPSESLAMLRNELARTRSSSSPAAQARAPVAPRKPLGAARKPGKSPADGTRDRVMFVWHGRHFLAPIEGRHPLRVAQSLYDFMVEEAMEHG